MRISFGIGVIVIVLITAVLALLGIVNLFSGISAFLIMLGVWCIAAGFGLGKKGERYYYAGWGVILLSLSTAYYIPLQYSIAIALIFIIIIILASKLKPIQKPPGKN
jgi:lysylphosphatidylglycerol synthetase-like protein (DUF2156 family)